MLPADGPASGSEHVREPGYYVRPDPQFGHADGQARRVLDAHVLDVDAGVVGSLEQPGQLARPVRDDYLDRGEVPGRAAMLARDPVHPVDPALEQVRDLLDGLLVASREALQRVGDLGQVR